MKKYELNTEKLDKKFIDKKSNSLEIEHKLIIC
jgi:hypothetical protein